jgi:hypothetical protein
VVTLRAIEEVIHTETRAWIREFSTALLDIEKSTKQSSKGSRRPLGGLRLAMRKIAFKKPRKIILKMTGLVRHSRQNLLST